MHDLHGRIKYESKADPRRAEINLHDVNEMFRCCPMHNSRNTRYRDILNYFEPPWNIECKYSSGNWKWMKRNETKTLLLVRSYGYRLSADRERTKNRTTVRRDWEIPRVGKWLAEEELKVELKEKMDEEGER